MSLKAVHDNIDDIPEVYRDLYTERDGRYELTGIEGVKTEEDVRRLQGALEKERNDHRSTKTKFEPYSQLGEYDELMSKLDRLPELEAAAESGGLDESKLDELATKRAQSMFAPERRKAEALERDLGTLKEEVSALRAEKIQRFVHDALHSAASEAKMLSTAIEDAKLLGERVFKVSEVGEVLTEDGLTPEQWLADMQSKRPHWWPQSVGGGARGTGGSAAGFGANPFSAEHWNMGEQGRILREKGKDFAERLAKAAGTTVGGRKPSRKQNA